LTGEPDNMTRFEVVPDLGKRHRANRPDWLILKDGVPLFQCSTGDTGPCWNIDNASTPLDDGDDRTAVPMHLCDLDEAIAALTALRDSDAYRLNEERWA
jgi:hypothetical protein